MTDKKKVSAFEFAIASYADPEYAKTITPKTKQDELKRRRENLMRQASKMRIKK